MERRTGILGSIAVAVGLSTAGSACHHSPPVPARHAPVVDAPPVEDPPPSASPEPVAPPPRPFAWERVRILGNGSRLAGPGLPAEAVPGLRVALLGADGATHVTTIESVDRDACEDDDGDPDACVWVRIPEDEPLSRPTFAFPGRAEAQGDDLVLVEATLAVTGDMALPDPVPHSLEVRYFDALCEGDADARNFALLVRATSAGPHPLAGLPALAPFRGRPQRVITLRIAGRSLHFVTAAAVRMPRSRRMFDLPRRRREAFLVVEGDGPDARVLHEETRMAGRTINHEYTCELPVHYPIPWSVVAVEHEIFVLTRAGLDQHECWLLTPTALRRAGSWTADALELF